MKSKLGLQITSLLLLLIINGSLCFNLDVNNYIRHEGQDGSMFGFSVALHQEQQRSWVIIGAPKADTSQYQPEVREGGAVYRCDISDDNRCQIIQFDSNGNNFNEMNEQIDNKSYQWFGATVSSAGIDGPLVACAPRYVYYQHKPKKVERKEPVGTCFIAKDNFKEYHEYSPCRTMYWGYHRQGSCQAGMSAAVTKAGDRLFIGAPGSWYWQGQVYSINTDAVYPYKPIRYEPFGVGGQTYSYDLNVPKNKVYATNESSSKEDDSYLGYSSVAGDFTGDGLQGVAVGMPRGGGLLGKVLVFSWNLTNQINITGEQIGAYFGYALATVDVDGDKLDDLIVGAPMYTEPNNEGKYENGRVYIIYQNRINKFKEVETRDGINSKGRFGLSLTTLGDVNLDGYGDFAVGAPYDGPNGRGAVYIFHGSKNGPLPKASQVIFAEDVIGTDHLSTFGFSVFGGIDLDGNQYPDMVVGAYDSNRAIVFKSRAVAVMEATTSFEADNKLISLENKNCTITKDKKQVTCTTVTSCLKYNGINLPPSIDIEISWILDSKKPKTPRMFFINDETKNIRNSTMRLSRGKSECRSEAVYIADGIRDKLTPLEVEMKYSIRNAATSYTTSTVSRRRRATLDPVLDENRGTVQRDSINIMKNCGRDNICIPDLRLDVKTVDKYLLGTNESLAVDIMVSNYGEDAFEATFFMNIPKGLDFKSTKKIGTSRDTSYICTAPSVMTNNTLKCDIGNPLPAGKSVNFKVFMEPSKRGGKDSYSPVYDFYMEANSTNEEAAGGSFDNILKKSVGIFVESDLSITGSSNPPDFHYNVTNYKEFNSSMARSEVYKNYVRTIHEAEIGPQVVHIYDIRNSGTSTIEEIEFFINWPAETLDGEPLMYLMNQPETLGPIKCDQSQHVNTANIQSDRVLDKKSYLDKNRSPIRQGESGYYASSRNAQDSATFEERRVLDRVGSGENTADGTYKSHSESWKSQRGSSNVNAGRQSGSGGVSSQTSYTETHHQAGNSGDERMSGSQGSQGSRGVGWNGGFSGGSSGISGGSQRGYQQGSSGSQSDTQHSSGSRNVQGGYDRSSQFDSEASSGGNSQSRFGGGSTGTNVREFETHESWNSSSVNGGPVLTQYASRNRNVTRGQDGRVSVSETSTERIIQGGVAGSRWESSSGSRFGGQHQDSSATVSQTDAEYNRQREEYMEIQRREQEEKRVRQQEDRTRRVEQQRREEQERYRLEEARRTEEEERRRLYESSQSSQSSRTQSQSQGRDGSGYESSFNRQSESRFSGGSGGGSRSSTGSSSSSSTGSAGGASRGFSSGGASGGRSEVQFESNVDQDISTLAARTHAEQSGSGGQAGRRRMQSQQDGEAFRPDLVTGVTTLERAAQGRSGFQTTGLDIGVLGARTNVDDEIRRQSSASGGIAGGSRSSSSSHNSQFSSGGRQTGSTSSSHGYTHSSTGGGGGSYQDNSQSAEHGNADDYEYEDHEDEQGHGGAQHGSQHGSSSSWNSRSSSSYMNKKPLNSNYESIDQQFRHYPKKREVSSGFNPNELCKSLTCVNVRCVVGPLSKNTEAFVALRTRMVAHTLAKLGGESEVKLSTMAIGRITKLPYVGEPSDDKLKTHEVFVTAIPDPIPKPDVVPLWIVVLAACAGALILLLLIYLLYKCGFFKRNRPQGSPHERQPLNRNGNYHGDEHL